MLATGQSLHALATMRSRRLAAGEATTVDLEDQNVNPPELAMNLRSTYLDHLVLRTVPHYGEAASIRRFLSMRDTTPAQLRSSVPLAVEDEERNFQ
jgi:hypothetical protein